MTKEGADDTQSSEEVVEQTGMQSVHGNVDKTGPIIASTGLKGANIMFLQINESSFKRLVLWGKLPCWISEIST